MWFEIEKRENIRKWRTFNLKIVKSIVAFEENTQL